MNIVEALEYGRAALSDSDSPEVDSQVLLGHILECTRSYFHTWPEKKLTLDQQKQFETFIEQRQKGKPVAHITGQRGFWSLNLTVTPDTLIPRPDTELLVSLALEKLKPEMTVADLGTGTGAVGLSLAQEVPSINLFASDASPAALDIARINAINNKISNVQFWQGSWLDAIKADCLDMIVSNPPYIEADDEHLSQGDVRFEPLTALASGLDGLDDIRHITVQAQQCLNPAGWLLIEHGYHQAGQVQQLFSAAGFVNVSSHKDYGDNDRVVMGQQPV